MRTQKQTLFKSMIGGSVALLTCLIAIFAMGTTSTVHAQTEPTPAPVVEPTIPPIEPESQQPIQLNACLSPCTLNLNNIFIGMPAGTSRVLEFDPQNNKNTGRVLNWPIRPYIGAITPDGKRLFMGGWSSTAALYEVDLPSYTMSSKLPVQGNDQRGLVISKDGTRLYVADNYYQKVTVVDLQSNQVVATIPLGTHPEQIALSPDDSRLYVAANTPGGTLVVIDTATNSVVNSISITGNPHGVDASKNGKHVFLGLSGGQIKVFNTSDFSLTTTMHTEKGTAGYLFSNADGTKLYALSYSYGLVHIFNTTTFKLIKTVDVQSTQRTGTVSRDGAYIYIGTAAGLVTLDAFTDKLLTKTSFSQTPYAIVAVPGKSIPPDLIIQNGGFNGYTTNTAMIPIAWQALNFSATDGKSTTAVKEGTASVKIDGASGISKTLYQVLLISGEAGDAYTFAYWVKGTAIPADAKFCRGQVFVYNDDILVTAQTIDCPIHTYAEFQKKSLAFTISGAYNKAVVRFTYSKPTGRVWFDTVSLVKQ